MNWVERLQVERIFEEEVAVAGGELQEGRWHREQLFLRALLPAEQEVVPGDRLRAGVALRTGRRKIRVHPYFLRLICRNGFVIARVVGSETIDVEDEPEEELEVAAVHKELRGAIRRCGEPKALSEAAAGMRRALDEPIAGGRGYMMELELLLSGRVSGSWEEPGSLLGSHFEDLWMALSARMLASETRDDEPPPFEPSEIGQRIRKQLEREESDTRFGLMNAVTAVARDVENPKVRWWLEALGGSIALGWRGPNKVLRGWNSRRELPGQSTRAA